ncbi:hypothetical protein ACWD4L_41105 [Streptomyces sp. NPDC002596]
MRNRRVVYEPDPAQRRSDWLFEREWRLCFEDTDRQSSGAPPNTADASLAENLAVARSYAEASTLAAPVSAYT